MHHALIMNRLNEEGDVISYYYYYYYAMHGHNASFSANVNQVYGLARRRNEHGLGGQYKGKRRRIGYSSRFTWADLASWLFTTTENLPIFGGIK